MITNLVLASASPRRSKLLRALGLPFTQVVSNADEHTLVASYEGSSYDLAIWLAEHKARAVAMTSHGTHRLILAADTTVIFRGRELGKPPNAPAAAALLRELRGQQHDVVTGVVLLDTDTDQALCASACTTVTMRAYSDEEIATYVTSGDPLDKAGAYAIQHHGFHPVEQIAGCYPNVIGLPLCLVVTLLRRVGITPPVRPHVGLCGWSPQCTPPLPEAIYQ